MNLNISIDTFREYIKEINIHTKNELLVCIPTFNSLDTTSNAIENFYKQEDINFDILIIGASGDVEKLSNKYPEINFCITNNNYGGCGNFLLSIFISKFYKYKYTILSDNDFEIINKDGLKKMMKKLIDDSLYLVKPADNVGCFHCGLFSNELFDQMDYFFNPNYFLVFDDGSLDNRLLFLYPNKIYCMKELTVFHPKKTEKILFNKNHIYFFTRSLILFLLRERLPLLLKIKILVFNKVFYIPIIYLLKYKIEYLRLVRSCIKQVFQNNFNLNDMNLLNIKTTYKEIDEEELKNHYFSKIESFKRVDSAMELFFEPKQFFYTDNNLKNKFFKKIN